MKDSMKLGHGGRFKAVERHAAEEGARDPAAVAAAVGRKKYGEKKMEKFSKEGKARKKKRELAKRIK